MVKPTSIAKPYKDIRRRQHGNRVLIVRPDTSGWAILKENDVEVLDALDGKCMLRTVAEKIGLPESFVVDTVSKLYRVGLVQVDGDFCSLAALRSPPLKRYPKLAVIHVNEYCNMRCRYCYTCFSQPSLKSMRLETICRIIDEMLLLPNQLIAIEYHGGEPTTRLDLLEASMDYGVFATRQAGKRIKFLVQSNGTLITDRTIEIFRKHDVEVRISIDGPPEINDRYRVFADGSPSSGRIEAGIHRLLDAGIAFDAVVVVTMSNVEHLIEIVRYLRFLGITSIRFLPMFVYGHASQGLYVPPLLYHMHYLELIKWVIAHNRENPINRIVLPNLVRGELQSVLSFERTYMCMQSPCGAGLDMLDFHDNGDVYPCEEMNGQAKFKIGNIFNTPLKSMLDTSQVVARLRARSIDNIPKCSKCTWKRFCGGGCTNKSNLTFGSLERESDYCAYYEHIYEDLIWILDNDREAAALLLPPAAIYRAYVQ